MKRGLTDEDLKKLIKGMTHGAWDDAPVCMCPGGVHRSWKSRCVHGVSTAPCMDCAECDAGTEERQ